MSTLAGSHDCLLLDLDGTAFRGHAPTDGAIDALAAVPGQVLFVTNNASRSPVEVAEHLRELGFSADPEHVCTSAQSAAGLLAHQLPQGARVLVVGTESLAALITAVGLCPVRCADDDPVAVVQGHSPTTGWADLAEAALAIRAGARWVATNGDLTLPTERGLLPGNGSMVAALRAATAAEPQIAGKPAPTSFDDAISRGGYTTPLVVGDRLDTDIEGANAAGLPSLLVLTGVSSAADAVFAEPALRPTYIGSNLRALHADAAGLAIGPQPDWQVVADAGVLTVTATGDTPADPGDGLSIVRAVAHVLWSFPHEQAVVSVDSGDDRAREELQRWSLLRSGGLDSTGPARGSAER